MGWRRSRFGDPGGLGPRGKSLAQPTDEQVQPDRRQDCQRRYERHDVAIRPVGRDHQDPEAKGRPSECGHRQPRLRLVQPFTQGYDREQAGESQAEKRQEQEAEDVVALAGQVGLGGVEHLDWAQVPLKRRPDLEVDRHRSLVGEPDRDHPDQACQRDHGACTREPAPYPRVAPAPYGADGREDSDHREQCARFGSDSHGIAQAGDDAAPQAEAAVPCQHERAERQAQDHQVFEERQPAVEQDQAGEAEGQAGEGRARPAHHTPQAPDQRRRRQRDTQDHRQAGLDYAHAGDPECRGLHQAERQVHQVEIPLVRAPDPDLDEVACVDDVEGLVGERGHAVGDLRNGVGGGKGSQDREQAEADQDCLQRNAPDRAEPAAQPGRRVVPAIPARGRVSEHARRSRT